MVSVGASTSSTPEEEMTEETVIVTSPGASGVTESSTSVVEDWEKDDTCPFSTYDEEGPGLLQSRCFA